MKHNFLFLGKTKEKFMADGIDFYLKRLRLMTDARQVILKGASIGPSAGAAEENKAKFREGQNLLEQCSASDYLVALDIGGTQLSSTALAKHLDGLQLNGVKTTNWVLGGPWGLDEAVTQRADMRLSFGQMTFPHDLARLMLLEQVYRAYAILANSPYHK